MSTTTAPENATASDMQFLAMSFELGASEWKMAFSARDRTIVEREAWRAGGGPARLGTVVSCLTARAARPGAQRRDTPEACSSIRRATVSGRRG